MCLVSYLINFSYTSRDTLFTRPAIWSVPEWQMMHMLRSHSVLKVNDFLLSCLLQSDIGFKAKKIWLCHFRDSKDLKSTAVIKELWFSLCGTSLSHRGMSGNTFLERVLRRSWLGYWLLSYRVPSNKMEWKTVSFFLPVDGISLSSLLSPMYSQVFQPVKARSPTLRLPLREVLVDTGEGLRAHVISIDFS